MMNHATHSTPGGEAGERPVRETAAFGRAAAVLVALGVVALAGAGLLMWASQGPAVFNEVVLAALAWCF
ncbi:hypothetical protein [Salinarimonas chemoclinalis]|uniref:hypothetical protein n=1 Tax=Salinarimonas chemoclinalis TaxID=3241599 RepID=UPI00355773B4